MRARPVIAAAFCFAFAPPVWAAAAPWIVRSDAIATELLRRDAQLSPEIIASQGVEGLDEQVTVISADFNDRRRKVALGEAAYLQDLLEKETDPHLREDLQILAKNARNQLRSIELDEKYNIPFLNVSDMVFQSLRSLLDEQIAPARRPAALVHLRKYTGQVKGFRPITVACADFTRSEARKPGLLFPVRAEVERALATSRISAEGIEPLFKKAGVKGYERAVALFKRQLADYDAFLRREVLPKARVDFRMPEELYAFALSQVGVEMPPAELAARAHQAFSQTQAELQVLAGKIARDQHLPSADYRDVLRALKQKQLTGDALVATYRQRLKDVEAIIQREQLVTLPERAVRIRVASDAESANSPAPYYNGPAWLETPGSKARW